MIDQFLAVRAVLLSSWDPIGISDIPEAQDEYDAYIWPIVRMINEQLNEADFSAHLLGIEQESMGLSGDQVRCAAVVRQLRGLGRAS